MPEFLERQLKKQYGSKSDVPYKIMNKLGYMKGSQVTQKGKVAEKIHRSSAKAAAKQLGF